MACWLAGELFAAGGADVAIAMTPGDNGVLQVKIDDDLVYDKAAEDGQTPNLNRAKEIKAELRNRIEAA